MSNAEERSEKAKALLASRRVGSLSTLSKRRPGFPFGSVVNYAVDAQGRPVHMKNLAEDARVSFLVYSVEAAEDAVSGSRVTIMGEVVAVPEEEVEAVKAAYLARHPAAEEYVDFGDFGFFRLEAADTYYVGGFGEMGWL
jgi:heme iron utilization protein